MRFSKLLIPTSKEVPTDAVLVSHIYLLRGGFIQNAGGSGLYNFLPLGKRVLDKIKSIIKEELDSAGAQEVSLSFVTPAKLWEESGRIEKYGKELLRFKDRKENDFVLGPTHEEMMVDLVRQSIRSYKQLPVNLYQINLKFRDEIRPRFGLMRGREFLMKDGYSFHANEEDMKREFNKMESVYRKIFTRLGLDFRVVQADSGAIGGSESKEFMVLAQSGEDTIAVCKQCEYAANIETAKRKFVGCEGGKTQERKKVHTPNIKRIEDLKEFFSLEETRGIVKCVVKQAVYDDSHSKIVVFALCGDDVLQETKALNAIKANALLDVDEAQMIKHGIVPGFIGPFGLPEDVMLVLDERVAQAKGVVCGANETDYHYTACDLSSLDAQKADIAQVREGDQCPECGGDLSFTRGIEVGHIFQLGTRYSEPLKCRFLDENGKSKPMVMGTYGIGVSRLLSAIIEQNHDEKGCIWTSESTPFDVVLIVSNTKDESQMQTAQTLYDTLQKQGIEVLYDDRNDRFGSKMNDFELIGIPLAVIIGKRLQDGEVEIVRRKGLEKETCPLDDVVAKVQENLCF